MSKKAVAIVGSGNIGTDLMYKLLRSDYIEPQFMIGIDHHSEGLVRAKKSGLEASHDAPRYKEAGIHAVDLTPAALGPYVIPPVNLTEHVNKENVNMVTCGGQATIPMVHAVSRVVNVEYAEIVATIASKSAGPGTRQNIDEFTSTTSKGIEVLGGAGEGKAIIILNPAEPPLIMRDTIYCSLPDVFDQDAITKSIHDMEIDVQSYVLGYRLISEPQFDDTRVAIFIEVEGAGDFLPTYAGNLDIMTAAAVKVGEEIAKSMNELVEA